MKRIYLFIIPVLLVVSCKKGNNPSFTETITKGEKWGVKIGSSHSEIFTKLQQISLEKGFDKIAVVYRQPFSKPDEIKRYLAFYQAITLINQTGRIERAVVQFNGDKVNSIGVGGSLLTEVLKWPENVSDQTAIHVNDPVNEIYDKLLAIYNIPAYSKYQIILPDKTLAKPFDPDMVNYDEWAFSFSSSVKSGIGSTSSVRLFFKDGRLDKIRHEYMESEILN